jgi:hypothetical protein
MFTVYQKHTRRQGRATGVVAPGGTVHGAAKWIYMMKYCNYLRSKYIVQSNKQEN